MTSRTKIVCTMGPAVSAPEKIEALIESGMNVARLNFSHGTHAEHAAMIAKLKAAREKLGVPLAIMLDTKGPEIRLGGLKEPELHLEEGQQIRFVKEEIAGTAEKITLTPPHILDGLEPDMFVLLNDGYIITHVVSKDPDGVVVEVDHGGTIKPLRGVNIPGQDVELPALTDKDREDIKFGCEHDVDLIAASFVRSPEHVFAIKKILEEEGKPDIAVIAKIENKQGVMNFDSIVQVADGIMIARGDLGVELPLTQVPRLQKMMIRKCYLAGKPSVTATQMLESMIYNPRPTRAETSDVANAIYDSTSAVMLSGETAVGKYPVETVKVMKAIIKETEKDFDYYDFLKDSSQRIFHDVPSAVSQASIRTAYSARARAIFAFTSSGSTVRLLARLRPEMPIIALTSRPKVYHQLALNWGTVPVLRDPAESAEEAFALLSEFARERGYVKDGDLVVITAGTPFGQPGTTNMMIVDSIGDVLVRGSEGAGERVHGTISIVASPESRKEYEVRGTILLLTTCDDSYLPLIKQARGVILQNLVDDKASEIYLAQVAKQLRIPFILRAENANKVLREEQLVTLDPSQAIIYKGNLN